MRVDYPTAVLYGSSVDPFTGVVRATRFRTRTALVSKQRQRVTWGLIARNRLRVPWVNATPLHATHGEVNVPVIIPAAYRRQLKPTNHHLITLTGTVSCTGCRIQYASDVRPIRFATDLIPPRKLRRWGVGLR